MGDKLTEADIKKQEEYIAEIELKREALTKQFSSELNDLEQNLKIVGLKRISKQLIEDAIRDKKEALQTLKNH